MSPKQKSLYWRTWSALCDEFDWRHNDTARRHSLHQEAACPTSSKEWDNKAMDRFLAHSRALLAGKRTGGKTIIDEAGERRRLEWRIRADLRRAGLDTAYVAKLATDLYGLGCWSLLSLDQLTNLRDTIHNRTRRRAASTSPRCKHSAPTRHGQCNPPAPSAAIPIIDGALCPF